MEKVKGNPKILQFVTIDKFPYGHGYGDGYGYGYGYGSGYGYGYGYGYGDGYGHGYGSGYGYGDGYGSGYGYGDGYGSNIEYLNGKKVYKIDSIPTLIDSVHGYYAKGRILSDDLTTKECYIAKKGNFFAHGATLKQAFADVLEKFTENQPLEERIRQFNAHFPNRDEKVPAIDLFSWHHILTGSCLMGRKEFCREHGIDYETEKYSVNEFIEITQNAYGGDVIRQLKEEQP